MSFVPETKGSLLQIGRRKLGFRKGLMVVALYLERGGQGPGKEVVIQQQERLGWKLTSGLERCVCGSVICSGPVSLNLAYPTQRSGTHSFLSLIRQKFGVENERGSLEHSQGNIHEGSIGNESEEESGPCRP